MATYMSLEGISTAGAYSLKGFSYVTDPVMNGRTQLWQKSATLWKSRVESFPASTVCSEARQVDTSSQIDVVNIERLNAG